MRTARLDFVDPDHPVSVVHVDDPLLPRSDWARVVVAAAGDERALAAARDDGAIKVQLVP